jgi:hypothetical protein
MNERAPIWRAGKLAAVGYLFLVLGFALALHDLANSNRPHELTKMLYAYALAFVALVLCGFVIAALRRAWRARREVEFRAGHLLPWAIALTYVLIFVGYAAFMGLALLTSLSG